MTDIGKNIKQLREIKNFNQNYMADKLGISQRNYSNFESNGNKLSLEYLFKICEILNVSVTKVLELNAETIFNNNSQSIETLNNQVTNHGIAEQERKLYESLLTTKDAQIKAQVDLIEQLKKA